MLVVMNAALPLPRCESCTAVAIRGAYCADHAIACDQCGLFFGADDIRAGICDGCRESECDWFLETYIGARCTCGSSKPSHTNTLKGAA